MLRKFIEIFRLKNNNSLQSFSYNASANNFYHNSSNQSTGKYRENTDMEEIKEIMKQILKVQTNLSVNPLQQNHQIIYSNCN